QPRPRPPPAAAPPPEDGGGTGGPVLVRSSGGTCSEAFAAPAHPAPDVPSDRPVSSAAAPTAGRLCVVSPRFGKSDGNAVSCSVRSVSDSGACPAGACPAGSCSTGSWSVVRSTVLGSVAPVS